MASKSAMFAALVFGSLLFSAASASPSAAAAQRTARQVTDAQPKYDSYSGYGGGSYGGYGGGYGGYGGNYGMMSGGYKEKDSSLESLLYFAIPLGLALLALPLLALLLAPLLLGLIFFIGRSDSSSPWGLNPALFPPDFNLLRTVHEAFATYSTLSTSPSCRKRVICEIGYVIKRSDKRSIVIAIVDRMLPKMFQSHLQPLQESLRSNESGKCDKYECDATINLGSLFSQQHNNNRTKT